MAAQQQHQSSTAHSSLADRHNRGLDSANQQHDLGRPDVTIACEGGSFNAHRTILSSRSCYLRRLLVEFSERYPSQQPVVILNDLKLGDIRSLINYMYNNKLNVPFEPSSSIEQAAKILCIDSLLGIRSEHATTYSTDVHRVIALDQRFDQMNDIELSTDSHQSHSFLPQSLANLDQGVAAVAAAAASAHQNTNQQQSLRATIPIHNLAQCGAGGSQSNINSALMHNYIEPSMAPSSANRKKQRKPASSRLPLSGTNNQHTFAQSNIIPSHQNRSSRAGNDSTFLEPSSHILMSNNFGRSDATLMLNNKKHKKSRHQHQPGTSIFLIDSHSSSNKPRSRCPWCAKSMSSKYNLSRHIRNIHGASDKDSLPIISVGKYKLCPICSKTMSSKFNLQRHMKNIHQGAVPTQVSESTRRQPKNPAKLKVCQYCNKTLSHKYNLERHIRNVHGMQSSE